MTKVIEKLPEGLNIHTKRTVEITYREYCAQIAEKDAKATPMPFAEFAAIVDEARSNKESYDKINFGAPKLAKLKELGWETQLHTSASGPNKGVPTKYMVNDDPKANGTGFLNLNRTRLEETKRRLQSNIDAIDVMLAD